MAPGRAFLLLTLALAVACAPPKPAAPSATSTRLPPPVQPTGVNAPGPPAPSPAPPVPTTEAVEFGMTAIGAPNWGVFVAQTRGYFEALAIVVNETVVSSAAAGVVALVSGSLDIVSANPDPMIRAVARGSDIGIVGATVNPPIFGLYSSKPITTVAGLRGQTLSIGGREDVTAYLLDHMLAPNGLRRDNYETVYAGGADRLRALQVGAVQGALLIQPFDVQARREGYPLLLQSNQYVQDLPFAAYAVSRAWLGSEPNRGRLVRWLAAAYRGSQDLCDPAQKDAMVRILADKTRVPEEDARETYELLIEETRSMKCDLRLRLDELQKVIDYIAEMGDLAPPLPDPSRIVETSPLDQAIARVHSYP